MQKTTAILAAIITLLCSCGPAPSVQTSSQEHGAQIAVTFNDTTTLYFSLTSDSEAELTWDATEGKNYNSPTRHQHAGELTIPAEITHNGKSYRVTSIGDNALFQQRSLKGIYISDGIRRIGRKSLSGCDKLKSLRLPATLESMGEEALSRCKQLAQITLPDCLKEIGKYALHDCKMLKKANIPASITALPEGMFDGCYSLTDIKFHNGVEGIGVRAFSRCESLKKVKFPESLKTIEQEAFSHARSLEKVSFPDSIDYIPVACFHGCTSLRSIELNKVETISHGAFAQCNALASLKLPETLTAIGRSAFAGCAGITEVTIPTSVTFIADNVFVECGKLKEIYLLRTKPIEIESENAFPRQSCRINIPKGSLDSYQFTPKWKKFNYREVIYQ